MAPAPTKLLFSLAGALVFIVLATANAAGYRYGVSDQAFYIPAILDDLQPALFPDDSALIESQARLMVLDELLAGVIRQTGISLPLVFAAGYVASLALLWAALLWIGPSLYRSPWTTAALALAFTMRHRIPKTSANSFEPYFHPRMIAFAFGALAVGAVLRRRPIAALALTGVCLVLHPTTGLFFGVLIGVALLVSDRRMRPWLVAAAVAGMAASMWALLAGPLRDRLVVMDDAWRAALAGKDSVFPSTWPAWAWGANLALAGIWAWAYRVRRRHGAATAEDAGLLAGGGALVALFLITLPLVEIGVAFFVQLQVSRVFWMIDFLATAYALAALETSAARAMRPGLAAALAALLFVAAAARGTYILWIEHPERALFQLTVPPSPWSAAMRWLSSQPSDIEVLADPGHAWKYGTSVRVGSARDVFLDEVKDSAVAMYSREVAMRVMERTRAVGDFSLLTAAGARALDARYDLDYVVTTARLDLPVAYRNQQFTIYDLR